MILKYLLQGPGIDPIKLIPKFCATWIMKASIKARSQILKMGLENSTLFKGRNLRVLGGTACVKGKGFSLIKMGLFHMSSIKTT